MLSPDIDPHILNAAQSQAMKILLITKEFKHWHVAKNWCYGNSFALEDGILENGHECLVVVDTWLENLSAYLAKSTFDQIWIEIVHSSIPAEFLEAIPSMTPVRVAMLPESIYYSQKEYDEYPPLKERHGIIFDRLKYMTHALAVDEKDAQIIQDTYKIPSLPWLTSVPRSFIPKRDQAPTEPAFFGGSIYGERDAWLKHPALVPFIRTMKSSERGTPIPFCFNLLHRLSSRQTRYHLFDGIHFYGVYIRILRMLRRKAFSRWIKSIQEAHIIVNLPSMVKSYPGRIFEAIAAGRPVVTWIIPDRPFINSIFCDGREIIMSSSQEDLARKIQYLLDNPGVCKNISSNARDKLMRYHTADRRVKDILSWIKTGVAPSYGE